MPDTIFTNGFRMTLPQRMLVDILNIDWISKKSRPLRICALFHGCMELAEKGIPAWIFSAKSNEIAIPPIGNVTLSIDGKEREVKAIRREVVPRSFIVKMIMTMIRNRMENNGYQFIGQRFIKKIDNDVTWELVDIEFAPLGSEYYLWLNVGLLKENICDDLLKLNEPNMEMVLVEVKKRGRKILKSGVIVGIVDKKISDYEIKLGDGYRCTIHDYYRKRGEILDPNEAPVILVRFSSGDEFPFPPSKVILRGIDECMVRISPRKRWKRIMELLESLFNPPVQMGEYIISPSKKPWVVEPLNDRETTGIFLPKGWPRGPLLRFRRGLSRDPRGIFSLEPLGGQEEITIITFAPRHVSGVGRAMSGIKTELRKLGISMKYIIKPYHDDPIEIKNMPFYDFDVGDNVAAFAIVPEETDLKTLYAVERAVNVMDWDLHFMREKAFKARLAKGHLKREMLRTGLSLLLSAIRNKLFNLRIPFFIGWDLKFPTGGAKFPGEVLHIGAAVTRPYSPSRGLISVVTDASGHILGARTLHLNSDSSKIVRWWEWVLSLAKVRPWRISIYFDSLIRKDELAKIRDIIVDTTLGRPRVEAVVVDWNINKLLFGMNNPSEIVAPPPGTTLYNSGEYLTLTWQPNDNEWHVHPVRLTPVFTSDDQPVERSIVMEYLDLTRVNWWILLGPVFKNLPLELATRLAALFQRQ